MADSSQFSFAKSLLEDSCGAAIEIVQAADRLIETYSNMSIPRAERSARYHIGEWLQRNNISLESKETYGQYRGVTWDGVSRLVVPDTDDIPLVLHEVAHFQVAHPHRRFTPDYSLSSTPWVPRSYPSTAISYADEMAEEDQALLLGMLHCLSMGIGQTRWLRTNKFRSFLCRREFRDVPSVLGAYLTLLCAKGLIDDYGRPDLSATWEGLPGEGHDRYWAVAVKVLADSYRARLAIEAENGMIERSLAA